MDRKKAPALTSPWKVGFLVALLLVVTALGVAYFMSTIFAIQWTWLEVGGLSPTTWRFDLGAFLAEMLPLVALVVILALASHALVAGAVRRYKGRVDTGSELREVLRSIRNLEDLEDDERFETLKRYPEVRECLMSIRKSVARERQSPERTHAEHTRRQDDAGTRGNGLASETAILVSAIMNGRDGLSGDLALKTPELKQIERVVRERLQPEPGRDQNDARLREAESSLEAVRGSVAGLRRDSDACAAGAQEMERLLGSLKQAVEGMSAAPVSSAGIVDAVRRLDGVADGLTTLGEETKRIAIATALQASSAPGGDAVKVAEEVRGIATRFNAVAQQWRETGPALKASVDAAASASARTDEQRATLLRAVGAASAKTSLWGERLVALSEQVRGLERSCGAATAPVADWGALGEDIGTDDAVDSTVDITAPATEPAVESYKDEEPVGVAEVGAAAPHPVAGFTTGAALERAPEPAVDEHAPFVDIPGFEKENKFFDDATTEAARARDEQFEVDAPDAPAWTADAGVPEKGETAEETAHDADGFLTGPGRHAPAADRPTVRAPRTAAPVAVVPEPEPVAPDPDADAVDLYALGAVDYVESA